MRARPILAAFVLGTLLAGLATAVRAQDEPRREVVSHFFVPAGDSSAAEMQTVVGNSQPYAVKAGDTFVELARKFDVGYNELVLANPDVDPWVPRRGQQIVVPTEWILPKAPYEGLVLNIPEMRIYYYVPSPRQGGKSSTVITYPVGLGRRDWQTPRAEFRVRGKTKNPTWVIPESIKEERLRDKGLTGDFIAGGVPENPLGKYRIELTLPSYAIHGTNKNWGVGMQVSHGCVRMYPEDIAAFFPLVQIGSKGRFVYEPVKVGVRRGRVLVEVHEDIYGVHPWAWLEAQDLIREMGLVRFVDPELLAAAVEAATGVPTDVSYVRWPEETPDTRPATYDEKGNLLLEDAGSEAAGGH